MTDRLSAIRCFPFLAVKHAPSYRQRKRSLDFARDDDTRNAPFPLPVIRCFPFLAVRRSPSYRQRKRSLGSASDDDTRNAPFPTHSLYDARDSHPPRCHFERSEKSFSSSFSHDSFAKPFTGSTAPAFPRHGVFRFSPSDARRLTANENDPSAPLPMTIRETRFSHTFFV